MVFEDNVRSLVHFMAYPGPGNTNATLRGESPPSYLLTTVKSVCVDPYFKGIEVTRVKDTRIRQELAALLADSGKVVTYGAQPVQLLNQARLAPTDIGSTDVVHHRRAVDRLKGCIDEALFLGAVNFSVVSGADPGSSLRRAARQALVESLDELCRYADKRTSELDKPKLNVLLETFDRLTGAGCKNQLIGPAEEALEVAQRVGERGHTNFALLYDLSHVPLLDRSSAQGETVETLRVLAPYLGHIHLGSCVVDETDPLYGDTHPSFDYVGSAVGDELLGRFVKLLREIDWRGGIGFEVTPHGLQQPEAAIDTAKVYFDNARRRVDVSYALGSYYFDTRRYFPEMLFQSISEQRVNRTGMVAEAARNRKRRPTLSPDGRLLILAADHPARHVTNVGTQGTGMGDRLEYLGRILRVMASSRVDGIMATPDVVDDLLIIDSLLKEKGSFGVLDNKLVIGSMNRSGLAGIEHEMDDRLTAYTARFLHDRGFDGGKMMFRIDPGNRSRYSVHTIEGCARMIMELNELEMYSFLEPLPVETTEAGYRVVFEPDALIRTVGVGAALGNDTSRLWLKIPYVQDYDRVTRATTLPILMLGGASTGNPVDTLRSFEKGMGSGTNVRGAMVGRNVLFPGEDDPRAVAEAASLIVHENATTHTAVGHLASARDDAIDELLQTLLGS